MILTQDIETKPAPMMTPSSDSDWQTKWQALAETKAALLTQTVQVNVAMNAVLPISHLPPEILSNIFRLCQWGAAEVDGGFFSKWISVTHVCHHWREVALHDPILWSAVSITASCPVNALAIILARSKQLPLDMHVSLRDVTLVQLPDIVRAWKLTLRSVWGSQRYTSIPPSAPLLTILHLEVTGGQRMDEEIQPTFFDICTTPMLKNLSLSSYALNWSQVVLPSTLTDLCIVYPDPDIPSFTPSCHVQDLVRVVQVMSSIQHLTFKHVLSYDPSSLGSEPSTTFALSHLDTIEIAGHGPPSLHFLDHFTYLATTSFQLDLHFERPGDVEFAVAPLRRILEIDHRKVDMVTISDVEMRFYTQNSTTDSSSTTFTRFLSIILNDLYFYEDLVLCNIVAKLPLHNISILRLIGEVYLAIVDGAWKTVLKKMPNVKRFSIELFEPLDDRIRVDFLSVLKPMSLVGEEEIHLLPLLSEVFLEGIVFCDTDEESDCEDPTAVLWLADALISRKLAGRQVEKLFLENCFGLHSEDIKLLEPYTTVRWDGREREPDSP
ncbi:hypothetical protein BXZ70DRAFT_374312 [Cristinia sonorae]|uniref:F-box domain-containing protein n=1 Tax=Cristinia sonorae TaxID=1940300 RepID=A0A8K0UJR8_9AGAR|nr:hypothetical protein BXZ70DRAFT_374312 [Cristinia sonorae]